MPIFEYQCEDCKTRYEVLQRSSLNAGEAVCPECNSKKNKKLFSTFSPSMGAGFAGSGKSDSNYEIPSGKGCAGGACGLN